MKRKIKLRMGLLSAKYINGLHSYLKNILRADPLKYFPSKLYYICFNSFCYIHEESGKLDKATLLYSGQWIGLIIDNKVYPSTHLFEKIYRETGFRASIIVNENGVKNFLYGKDILEESIVEKYPPLNNPISVIDRIDYRVIGIAEPMGKGVYKNIYDLGWFLRILG